MSDRRYEGSRAPALFVIAGTAVAAVAAALAGAAGGPYLTLAELNPWLVVFAVGLFAALFAAPFAIHPRIGGRLEADARWERALLAWGAVALALAAVAVLVGLASGFDPDTLAGSLALIALVEAGLVLATLVVWMISG